MKKVLLIMLTLGATMFAMAQPYNHDQSYYGNRNDHDIYKNSQVNSHGRSGNRPVYGHDNNVRNRAIISIGVESHNGYRYGQQPAYGISGGHQSNTVVITNNHDRREMGHARNEYRRERNEHGF